MQNMESGHAGTSQSMVMPAIEEEDTPEQLDTKEQDGSEVLDEEAVVEGTVEER